MIKELWNTIKSIFSRESQHKSSMGKITVLNYNAYGGRGRPRISDYTRMTMEQFKELRDEVIEKKEKNKLDYYDLIVYNCLSEQERNFVTGGDE